MLMTISINSSYISSVTSGGSKLYNSSATTDNTQIQTELRVDKFVSNQVNSKVLIATCDSQKALTTAQNYIQGNQSLENYKETFKEDFYHSLNFNVDKGYTTTQDKEDILQILEKKYNGYKANAISASVIECNKKGFNLYGEADRSAVYYDADYYYDCEEIKGALEECFMEISKEFNLDQTKVPKTSQHDNFNDMWAINFGGRCKFDAKNAAEPPEGFQMYYETQKYSAKDFQEGETYRLLAESNSTDGNSGVLYINIPKGLNLLKESSKLSMTLLQGLISKNNNQVNTITYDISSLISSYSGKSIEEKLASFTAQNCTNEQAGMINVNCGTWTMEAEIPFSTLTDAYYYKGSELSSYSAESGSSYLDYFIFAKSYIPERFKED